MTRATRALVLCTALAAALAGCSGGSYSAPDELCSAAVGSKVLAPLLPDGQKLEQSAKDFSPESYSCTVFVDKKEALYVTNDVIDVSTDPVAVKHDTLVRMGNPQKAAAGDDARIADDGGIAVSACTYEGRRQKFVAMVGFGSKHPVPKATADRRKALEDFLRAYLPKAMELKFCRR